MHDQSKHAGALLDPTVKRPVLPKVAGAARHKQRIIPGEVDDTDQKRAGAASDSLKGASVVSIAGSQSTLHERLLPRCMDDGHAARLKLQLRPIGLRAANAFVAVHHRHHGPTRGHKFSISAADAQGQIRGVVIAGRPVARRLDDGTHLEILRMCTDGTPNVCSMLYGAARRAAKAMGYRPEQIITYTLEGESGDSLRAAGWQLDGCTEGGSWDRPSRSRIDSHPTERKFRWHAT